jgi:hypothetical protein
MKTTYKLQACRSLVSLWQRDGTAQDDDDDHELLITVIINSVVP